MNYRNPRILALAQQHSCQACGRDDGTVVAAHSNQGRHGKGMSIKAHDCFVAFLDSQCHSVVDFGSGSRETRNLVWQLAHEKTIPLFYHLLNERGRQLLAEHA